MLGRLKLFWDAFGSNISEKSECEYCGNHFHDSKLLERHYDYCIDKTKQEDFYYSGGEPDVPDKKNGVIGREGWEKTPKSGNCDFCSKDLEKADPVAVINVEDKQRYCFFCAKIKQREKMEKAGELP